MDGVLESRHHHPSVFQGKLTSFDKTLCSCCDCRDMHPKWKMLTLHFKPLTNLDVYWVGVVVRWASFHNFNLGLIQEQKHNASFRTVILCWWYCILNSCTRYTLLSKWRLLHTSHFPPCRTTWTCFWRPVENSGWTTRSSSTQETCRTCPLAWPSGNRRQHAPQGSGSRRLHKLEFSWWWVNTSNVELYWLVHTDQP